ncbi:MAG: hypothetical protein HON23_05725 [Rickettsiales bacterium]|jgi:hypothetical protein|nr:hypothetical protein [Rickettsiales bacterium]
MLALLFRKKKNVRAYSMVELTMVIGIIAALLSAVLYARNLITNNKLLIVASEYQQFKTAYSDFYTFYEAVPGDMNNAYDFFGANCGLDDIIANGGCNGDGDDSIEDEAESYKSTQHLALAKLLDGEYSGSASSADVDDKLIKSHFDSGYYAPLLDSALETESYRGRFDKYHYIVFGQINGEGEPYDPILTPSQALKIDNKLDDGVMWNGFVQIRYNDAGSCNGSDLVLAGNYDLASESFVCNLLFYVDVH